MKPIALVLTLLITSNALAQKKYEEAMKRNLTMLDTVNTMAGMQSLANSFERIATAEKDKWLPWYYAAYITTILSYQEQDKNQVDGILDKAQMFIDEADTLEPNNSEIYAVKAFVLSARIMVNPMTRGAQYGPKSGTMLEKAIELNPDNPRPYMLKGSSAFYTPAAFGGGKDKAKPLFETSLEKYSSFKPANELMPDWGEERAKEMLEQCRE
jgi:hypothetical protein